MPNIAQITQMVNQLAPDTLYLRLINAHFESDSLLNILPVVPQGGQLMAGSGTWHVSVNFSDKPVQAVNRKIFEEPEAKINYTHNKIITLREIANVYTVDSSLQRITSGSPITSWEANQLDMCTKSVVDKFNYDFINGVDSDETGQFDGLMQYFKNHPKQVEDPLTIDIVKEDNAMQVEQFLDYCMAKIYRGANVVITTRLGGVSLLRSVNNYRNRGIEEINVGNKKYKQFMGLPIVEIEDDLFDEATLAKGIPVIFMRIDEYMDGVRLVIPYVGPLISVFRPGTGGTVNGVFVRNGGVNLISAPILVDPYCASMCFINQTKGPGKPGNA